MKPLCASPKFRISSQAGFSLVELIVVMAIFIVVIMLSSDAFNRIASLSSQQVKSSESNIQGIVGLEMLRSDIEHAGYGLPWIMPFVADFQESQTAIDAHAKGIDPQDFNDNMFDANIDANKVPRAVQSATAQSSPADPATDGRDYLVIKSAAIGMNPTSKKWTFVEGTPGAYSLKPWGVDDDDFDADERVIVLDSRTRRLIVDGAPVLGSGFFDENHIFSDKLDSTPNLSKPEFFPQQDTDVHLVYGIDDKDDLRVPYNRADYYIKRPTGAGDMPQRCAPGTGILYKALLNHKENGFSKPEYPLLECVADMQIVYGLDTNGSGTENTLGNEDALSGLSAKEIRDQLKRITVFVLTHEGQRDLSYQYPGKDILVGPEQIILPGQPPDWGRMFDLTMLNNIGNDWRNYRWKVYHFSVIPRNLNY